MSALLDDLLGGIPRVVVEAERCGLVDAVRARKATAAEHAEALSLSPRAVELVLDVLAAIAVVDKDAEGRYGPHAELRAGGMPWSHLGDFMRTGQALPLIDHGERKRGATYANVVDWLSDQFVTPATLLATTLGPAKRIVDAGAGGGIWSLTMARHDPLAHVIGLDLPEIVPRYAARAESMGVSDRATTISGSYFDVAPDGPVDRVLLASVLHLETSEAAATLIARAATWLAPRGELVIVDCLGGDAFDRKLCGALYATHLGLRTARGKVHTLSALRGYCTQARLVESSFIALDDPMPALGALVARRAADAT